MTAAEDRVRARIARQGPVTFSAVVAEALYGPDGFYTAGSGAGRGRDFLTSPAVGPLFGAVVARALDAAWHAAREPDPWIVVDCGAGDGSLAEAVLAAAPDCAPALRYVLVEVSPVLRAAAGDRLVLEEPAQVLGPYVPVNDESPPVARHGLGPLVTALAELPVGPFTGVVFANELLDNLPFDVYVAGEDGWREVLVGDEGGRLVEVLVPAAAATDHLPACPPGTRVPVQTPAQDWLRRALALIERGKVVVVDYARTTAEMAGEQWLRTYRGGGPGGPPLEHLGEQDITADVALDQLGLVRPPTLAEPQAAWLGRYGLGELRDAAAEHWRSRAAIGDLEALRARGRAAEADALCDPGGLGAFTACEWDVRASY